MAVMDLVLGPTLIGVLVNVFLFGCIVTQCYTYFITFKTDRPLVRGLVWFLMIADTLNSAFECVVAYEYTIKDFGDFVAVSNGNWRAGTGPVLIGLIAAATQAFFAYRVYRLTRVRWFFVLICFLIFLQCLGATLTGIAGSIITPFAEWNRWQVKAPIIVWLIVAALVDCILTFSLTFYLRKNRTGFAKTDHLITRLIRLTVQTGMLTATWAVLDLITYLAISSPIHLIFNLALPKLYTSSLLSSLNARAEHASDSSNSVAIVSDQVWHHDSSVMSGIHVSTTVHRDEFELTSKKTNALSAGDDEDPSPGVPGVDLDMDIGHRPKGEYSVKWS